MALIVSFVATLQAVAHLAVLALPGNSGASGVCVDTAMVPVPCPSWQSARSQGWPHILSTVKQNRLRVFGAAVGKPLDCAELDGVESKAHANWAVTGSKGEEPCRVRLTAETVDWWNASSIRECCPW